MATSSKLNKIFKTSPEVLIKKAFRKAYGKFESKNSRKKDLEESTYSRSEYNLLVDHHIISIPETEFLESNKSAILSDAQLSLDHKFKLLHSSYLNVSYGTEPFGRDGIKFEQTVTTHEQALHKINNSNQSISRKIASKLTESYQPIDWQKDAVSGFRWSESTWFKDISYGYTKGADVKVPWELARMQDLPNLAFAYKINPKNEYILELQNRVFDFYSANPPRYGVQWKTAMDVGIRAVNCLATYQLFREIEPNLNQILDPDFENIFKDFLFDHITFIDENNEFSEGQRGNHYLTNVVSMLLIISNFEENTNCNHLIDKYSTAYFTELNHQFYEDGGNFEASIPYHLLGVELILVLYNFFSSLTTNNKHLKTARQKIINLLNENKIRRIIDFSLSVIHSGYIPKIGDHDSGKYFSIFSQIHFYYSFFFNVNSFLYESEYFDRLKIKKLINDEQKLKVFKKSGIASFKNNKYETTVSFSSLGQTGKGGHNHNDVGSFVLSLMSRPFIIDPGTYCYTSYWSERNLFRSTNYHNTLSIEGIEQNIIHKETLDDLFWLFAKGEPFSVSSKNNLKTIFRYYKQPHIRNFNFYENAIQIHDYCEVRKTKKISFHCHPKVDITIDSNSAILSRDGINLVIKSDSNPLLEQFYYSPHYGTKLPSSRIIFNMDGVEKLTEIEIK